MSVRAILAASLVTLSSLVVGAGVFNQAEATLAPINADTFPESVAARFDSGFAVSNTDCRVGLANAELCFNPSPLESGLVLGKALPTHIPAMPAEISILIEIGQSYDEHNIYRFGQTLVLVREDGMIIDDMIQF